MKLFPLPAQTQAYIYNPVVPDLGGGSAFDPQNVIAVIISNVWKSTLTIAGIFFVLYFGWGAISWMTAGGDKSKIENAQRRISNGLIGLVLVAASVAIVQFIGGVLNIPFFQTLIFQFPTP